MMIENSGFIVSSGKVSEFGANRKVFLFLRQQTMKILFLGDFSGMHATLAAELRRRGHETLLVTRGSGYMATPADITVERHPGLRGSWAYLMRLFGLLPMLKGFDAVQLINPHFFRLKPGRVRYFFDRIREANGPVWLTLAGTDHYYVRACTEGRFRYSEYRTGDRPTAAAFSEQGQEEMWLSRDIARFSDYLYDHIAGAMSALYEYHVAAEARLGDRVFYTGIPIDLERLQASPLPEGPVKIFAGFRPERRLLKGAQEMTLTAREVVAERPGECELIETGGLAMGEYYRQMRDAHIVLDQLHAYTPATNALAAMAMGRVAVTGGEPEFYDFIGEESLRPSVAASPLRDWKSDLLRLIDNRDALAEKAAQGRVFVERHNDARLVADRFLAAWGF